MITKALFDVPAGCYRSVSPFFMDGSCCDLLLAPMSAELASLSPVVVEIQHTINKSFMRRANRYCLNVYERFKAECVLVTFCFHHAPPRSIIGSLTQHKLLPYCLSVPCFPFAREFILVTEASIQPYIDNDDAQLPPMVALAHFLISRQRSILDVERCDDPTIQTIYRIAKDVSIDGAANDEKNQLSIIKAASTMENQFENIAQTIHSSPDRAIKYAFAGRAFCSALKRRHSEILADDEHDAVSPMPPMDIPDNDKENTPVASSSTIVPSSIASAACSTSTSPTSVYTPLIRFVENFKLQQKGRMNWQKCFEEGRAIGMFKNYLNCKVLKDTYNRVKNI